MIDNPAYIIFMVAIGLGIVHGIYWAPRNISTMRSVFKTLPVLLLAIVAMMDGRMPLLAAALLLSSAGDAFLSREGEKMFLAGLGSFLAAHLVYVLLFLLHPGSSMPSGAGILAVILITLSLIVLVLSNLWKHLGAMKIPVVFYTLVIAAMNISAWVAGQELLLLVGVGIFVISDMVLAHELFVWQEASRKKFAAHTVWFTYLAAQALIVFSLLGPVY